MANSLLEFAIHVQRNLAHALVLKLKLDPLVHGQRVVKRVVTVLTGNTDLAGFCLNGLDGAIGALEQDLVLVARGVGTLDLHAQIVTKTSGLKIGIQRDIALAALELERLLKVDVNDLGVLGRLQVEVVAVARSVLGIVHAKLHDGTLGVGRGLVTKVGVGGVAELLGRSLSSGNVGRALAPGSSGVQTRGVGDAIIDIVLGDAIFLLAAHVVPDGKGTTDHLLVASRNRNVVVVIDRGVIDGVVVEVIEVITGVGNDVVPAVDAVDQVKAELVHLVHLGPVPAPEVHLAVLTGSALTLNVNGTLDPAEAAPHASGAARILHVLKEVVDEVTIRVAVGLVLVSTNVNHGLVVEDGIGTGKVLIPDGKRKGQGLIVLSGQVKVVVAAMRHGLRRTQVGTHVGECQGMCRHVELGDDVDTKVTRVLDELTEIGLGVPHVGARQIGLVLTVVATLLDVGLQTESVVSGVNGVVRILLDPNVVVGKVDLEVVKLEPGELLAHLLEPVEREGLTTHIENQATHLIQRIIAGDTLRDRTVTGLKGLQDGTGRPVGTGLGLGLNAHGVTNLHEIALVLKTKGLVSGLGQEDIACVGGAALYDGKLGAKQVLVIGGQLVGDRLELIVVVNNAGLRSRSKGTGAALPLTKLRQNLGSDVVARLDLELTKNGNGDLLERIGVLVALLGHLKRGLDLRIDDRLIDGDGSILGLSANDLLIVGTVIGDVVLVGGRQGDLELRIALLGSLDLDGIGQAVHVHLGRAAIDLELKDGNVAPCDTAIGVGIGVVIDIQTDKAGLMHLVKGNQVGLACRMTVVGVNGLPVKAIGSRSGRAIGNLNLVALGLAQLPEYTDALDVALLAQIDIDPVRTAVLGSSSVNRTRPAGARRRRIPVDGLGSAEGACLCAIGNSVLAASNILLRILGRRSSSLIAVELELVDRDGGPLGNSALGIGTRKARNVQAEEASRHGGVKRNGIGKRCRAIGRRVDVFPVGAIGGGGSIARRILKFIASRLIGLPLDRRPLYGLGRPEVDINPMGATGVILGTAPTRGVAAVDGQGRTNRIRLLAIRYSGFIEGKICLSRHSGSSIEQRRRQHDCKHAGNRGGYTPKQFGLMYRHTHVPFLSLCLTK